MIKTKYKETELGEIPEDWEIYSLGDKSEIYRGGSPRPIEAYITELSSGINWIKIGDVKPGDKYIRKTAEKIKASGAVRSRSVKPGDFILSNSMSFGRPYILAIDGCIHDGWLVIKNYQNTYNKDYLYYILGSSAIVEQYKSMAAGSSVQNLNKDKVAGVKVVTPRSIEEQSRIASALTSIDNLISSLDKLIKKKKNIKQGAMQQLLTGKIRIKGFSEPWIEKKLGLIGITYSGLTGKTKEDFGTGNAKYITFLNVLNNPILNPKQFEYVVIKDGERQNNCRCGDIFFNTSSETPEEVGICAMLDTSMDNLYLNSFCFGYRLTDSNVVPEYLAYYFRSDEGRKLMTVLAQGVTRYNMSKSAFNNAKILMPSNASEQKAITDVLISMDKEIESLKLKKAKYESVKQGMMQQLLTGKIRLV